MSRKKKNKARDTQKQNDANMAKMLAQVQAMQPTQAEQMAAQSQMQGNQLGTVGDMLGGIFAAGQAMGNNNPIYQMMGGTANNENPFAAMQDIIAKYATPQEQPTAPSPMMGQMPFNPMMGFNMGQMIQPRRRSQ